MSELAIVELKLSAVSNKIESNEEFGWGHGSHSSSPDIGGEEENLDYDDDDDNDVGLIGECIAMCAYAAAADEEV